MEAALDNFSEAISNAVQSILTHAGSSGHITEQERTNWNSKVPATRTVNGKALSSDVTLSAADVNARPNTWTPTASDVGAVPTTRKINNKPLSADVMLSAADVSAVPTTRKVNNKALSADISLTAADVGGAAQHLDAECCRRRRAGLQRHGCRGDEAGHRPHHPDQPGQHQRCQLQRNSQHHAGRDWHTSRRQWRYGGQQF